MYANHGDIGGRNSTLTGKDALRAELDWLDTFEGLYPDAVKQVNERRVEISELLAKKSSI